jgi:hypothetical protein
MFYDLLDLQLNNNNYRLLQVNKSVKNKFLTNFLIGLDSKYLKLDEPDMNKTSNYYKDKLNDKIMLQYNKNFSKANTSHLDYLSDICRVNLVIYDMAKNKQKYANNNGSSKTLYMLKDGTAEYLLLKENKNFMRTLLPMSLAEKLSGLSLEGGVDPPEPSVSNTSKNSIMHDNVSVLSESNIENLNSVQQQRSPLSTPPLPSPPLSPQSSGISQPQAIVILSQPIPNEDETKLIELIENYNSVNIIITDNFENTVNEELRIIDEIEGLMIKLELEDDVKTDIREYISVINTEIFLSFYFKSNNNSYKGGNNNINKMNLKTIENQKGGVAIPTNDLSINKTTIKDISGNDVINDINGFIRGDKQGEAVYLRYALENFLDTLHDFSKNDTNYRDILSIMTNSNNTVQSNYEYLCTQLEVDKFSKHQEERTFVKSIVKKIVKKENWYNINDEYDWNKLNSQFYPQNPVSWKYQMYSEYGFRNIIGIQNVTTIQEMQDIYGHYDEIHDKYPDKYDLKYITMSNPSTIIDSGGKKLIGNTEQSGYEYDKLCDVPETEIDDINVNMDISGFELLDKQIIYISKAALPESFYLTRVYDYFIGNVNLSDIYSSYFEFINQHLKTINQNYSFKLHFRLAEIDSATGQKSYQSKEYKYGVLCTLEFSNRNQPQQKDLISFMWNFKDNLINDTENINRLVNEIDKYNNLDWFKDPNKNYYITYDNFIDYDFNKVNDYDLPNRMKMENIDGKKYIIKSHKDNDYLEIINSYIFGNDMSGPTKLLRKRLLYTLKLIGDQGQVRFAKILKDHINNTEELKNKYSVLYVGNDNMSQLYGGLINIETVDKQGILYIADNKYNEINYDRELNTFYERLIRDIKEGFKRKYDDAFSS